MVKITPELAQRVINYLAKKPYEEVYKLIAELTKQANANDKPVDTLPVRAKKATAPAQS